MPSPTKEERLAAVHTRALERFDRCYSSQREMRLLCVQDRRFAFVQGAQFEGDLEQQFANRPRFEINKVHQSIIRIFSEYRNNRVTVDFRPEDDTTSDENADFLDGLYRADEQESGAQEAYDTAFEEGVAGGMGAWRLVHKYEDDEDEDDDRRRICLVPIPDADNSVFFDIDAKRYDKADASYGFVISGMQPSLYDDEYQQSAETDRSDWKARRKKLDPQGKGITSFDKVERMGCFDWYAPDVVYVAEYYEVEQIKEPVHFYAHPMSGEEVKVKGKEAIEAEEPNLLAQGFELARVKKVKTRKVHKYIIDGARVLEDCGFIAGNMIPVVPFYAKRLFVDNIERIMGHIRLATDAQRLYNMLVSLLAEISVHSPIEKPILTPAQIIGHESRWALDSVEPYPYMLINPTIDPTTGQPMPAQPIAYTKPPAIPPALAGLIQLIGVDMQEVLGNSGDQQEVVSNISAKAVELIQNRLDMQNFIYMDNFKKSMKRCGEIWLAMARELYDEEERPMRVVNLDGTDKVEKLKVPTTGPNEELTYTNDPAAGKFKVVADVGPSFTTRRDGTVRAITGMLQFVQDPADKAVLTAVAVKNLEGEGLEPVKKHFRMKMLALGLEEPTEEEAAEIAKAQEAQQPDAQTQFLLAEAQKSVANAEKALAEAEAARAEAKEREAKAAETLAKVEAMPLEALLRLVDALPQNAGQPAQPAQGAQPLPVA
jgi:hypothetical protein